MTFRMALALAPVLLLAGCKPDPAVVHREAGDDLLRRSDFAGAAAEYAQSLAADPRQEKVWERLAYAHAQAGEKRRAADALVKLADLQPEDARKADAFRNAAGLWLQGPERGEAERYLVEAIRLDPNDEGSLTWLGELASEKGGARSEGAQAVPAELDKALRYYDQVLALRPEAAAPHLNRRVVLVKYLAYVAGERTVEERRVRKGGPDAAAARGRLASLDGKSAELQQMLDETGRRLAAGRKPAR